MTHAELTTCADYQSLLRGVLEHPAADLPRLVLADWLEENGDGEYGEFVRLQIELAALLALPCSYAAGTWESEGEPMLSGGRLMIAWPHSPPARCCMPKSEMFGGGLCHKCARVDAIHHRRQELLAGVKSGHNWRHWAGVAIGAVPPGASYTDHLAFGRGFVSAVTLTMAAFVGRSCDLCGGGGYVYSGLESCWCVKCNGPGRTPGLAESLFRAHPITAVTLSDRTAVMGDHGRTFWWMVAEEQTAGPTAHYRVPDVLFRGLRGGNWDAYADGQRRIEYATRQRADAALSAAAVAYARDLAGLPPLPR